MTVLISQCAVIILRKILAIIYNSSFDFGYKYTFKITATFPRGQSVNSLACDGSICAIFSQMNVTKYITKAKSKLIHAELMLTRFHNAIWCHQALICEHGWYFCPYRGHMGNYISKKTDMIIYPCPNGMVVKRLNCIFCVISKYVIYEICFLLHACLVGDYNWNLPETELISCPHMIISTTKYEGSNQS